MRGVGVCVASGAVVGGEAFPTVAVAVPEAGLACLGGGVEGGDAGGEAGVVAARAAGGIEGSVAQAVVLGDVGPPRGRVIERLG